MNVSIIEQLLFNKWGITNYRGNTKPEGCNMFKSEKTNKVISLVMFWILAFLLLKSGWEIEGDLNLFVVVITVLYTVYQLFSIFKMKQE